jgi:uncharacterized RDD family membrane protein YckC/Tfp pilus assembly major pilin PilA
MFCAKCGVSLRDGSQFCASCGTQVAESSASAGVPLVDAMAVVPAGHLYAGFWRRVAAYLVDYGLLLIGGILLGVVSGLLGTAEQTIEVIGVVYAFFGFWLYCAVMESSPRQATFGKVALGIKVTDVAGERIGFGRATGRYFGEILSGLSLGIGYLMAGFTRQRQALHDKMAGTLVVRNATTPGVLAGRPAAPVVPVWAIALLILIGTLPTLGVLAVIAIPAYQDYTIRTQVAEGLNAAAQHRAAVAKALADGWDWPDIQSEALGLQIEQESPTLQSIEVVDGLVVITYAEVRSSGVAGRQLYLVPGLRESGEVVWICGYAPAPAGVESTLNRHEEYTDVDPKYLPSACRSQ